MSNLRRTRRELNILNTGIRVFGQKGTDYGLLLDPLLKEETSQVTFSLVYENESYDFLVQIPHSYPFEEPCLKYQEMTFYSLFSELHKPGANVSTLECESCVFRTISGQWGPDKLLKDWIPLKVGYLMDCIIKLKVQQQQQQQQQQQKQQQQQQKQQ